MQSYLGAPRRLLADLEGAGADQQHEGLEEPVVFTDEHKFKQFKEATRHDVVWAKSQSEVPGNEMERWGLTVDAGRIQFAEKD